MTDWRIIKTQPTTRLSADERSGQSPDCLNNRLCGSSFCTEPGREGRRASLLQAGWTPWPERVIRLAAVGVSSEIDEGNLNDM